MEDGPRYGIDYPGDWKQFHAQFPNEKACRRYLEKIRWLRRENGILRVVLEGGQSFVVSRRYQPPIEDLVIARNLIRKQIKTFGLKLRDLRIPRTAETLLVSERLEQRAM